MRTIITLEIEEQTYDCEVEFDASPGCCETSSDPGCAPQIDDILSCKLHGPKGSVDIWPVLDEYVRGLVTARTEELWLEDAATAYDDAQELKAEAMRDQQMWEDE